MKNLPVRLRILAPSLFKNQEAFLLMTAKLTPGIGYSGFFCHGSVVARTGISMWHERNPGGDGRDVQHLIRPDGDVKRFRSIHAVLVDACPPLQGNPRINDDMKQTEDRSSRPSDRHRQGNCINRRMDPGGRVQQAGFVFRHPIILQQPIRNQMGHERALERSEGHVRGADYRSAKLRQSFSAKPLHETVTGPSRYRRWCQMRGIAIRNPMDSEMFAMKSTGPNP